MRRKFEGTGERNLKDFGWNKEEIYAPGRRLYGRNNERTGLERAGLYRIARTGPEVA